MHGCHDNQVHLVTVVALPCRHIFDSTFGQSVVKRLSLQHRFQSRTHVFDLAMPRMSQPWHGSPSRVRRLIEQLIDGTLLQNHVPLVTHIHWDTCILHSIHSQPFLRLASQWAGVCGWSEAGGGGQQEESLRLRRRLVCYSHGHSTNYRQVVKTHPEPPLNWQTTLSTVSLSCTLRVGTACTFLRPGSSLWDRFPLGRYRALFHLFNTWQPSACSPASQQRTQFHWRWVRSLLPQGDLEHALARSLDMSSNR